MANSVSFLPTAGQLRAVRAWLGWTLDQAATASGVHKQTISRVENDERRSLDTIERLAEAYARHGARFERGLVRMLEAPMQAPIFDVDLNDRVVRHPSGVEFSFYEYHNEDDWRASGPSWVSNPDIYDGDIHALARAAKEAAVAAGMGPKKPSN